MPMWTLPISWIARLTLILMGWKLQPLQPERPRVFVGVLGHHTSHWDLVIGLLGYWSYRIPFGILVKKELFDAPLLGSALRAVGGVPVDRSRPGSLIRDCAAALRGPQARVLALAPSGTRSRRPGWKMGFYVIARRARCPLMLNVIDWKRKQVGLGVSYRLTGDVDADMASIRRFYAGQTPKYPEKATPIRPLPRDGVSSTTPAAARAWKPSKSAAQTV